MKINKYWLITITYCLIAVAFALCLSLLVRRLPDTGQPQVEKEIWVYSGHPVSQTITPVHDGFNVITIYLRNIGLRNQDPFLFQISDSTGVIRSISLTGYNIGDGDNVRFQFPPIMNSKNLRYTLTFSSESPHSTAIGIGYSDKAQSIAYQTFYYPTSRVSVIKSTTLTFLANLFHLKLIILFPVLFYLALIPCSFVFRIKSETPKS